MRTTLFTANWTDIASFNYAVDPAFLRPYLPSDLQLDTFEDENYLSVMALRFGDCSLLGAVPLLLEPTFPMIAFRIYVKRMHPDGVYRRGTVVIKTIAPEPSANVSARMLGKRDVDREPVTSNIFRGSIYLFWWGRISDNNWLEYLRHAVCRPRSGRCSTTFICVCRRRLAPAGQFPFYFSA